MALKPQDVYVVLKIVASGSHRLPYAKLAVELSMSPSEVHASVKRAQVSGLLHGGELNQRPNFVALEEFLVHGLKYSFPAERGELTRGLPTSYAAPPLQGLVAQTDNDTPVWPYVEGRLRGTSFVPLYKSAPKAALQDKPFYEMLALADALRDGRVRERKIAQQELHRRLHEARGEQKR